MLQITIIGSKKLLAARNLQILTRRLFTKKTALQSNKSKLIICVKPIIKYNHISWNGSLLGHQMLNWGRKNQLKIFWQRKSSLDVLVHEPAMEIWANRIVNEVLFLFRFLTSAVLKFVIIIKKMRFLRFKSVKFYLENNVIIPTTLHSSLLLCGFVLK